MGIGLASFGGASVFKKHLAAKGSYKSDKAKYDREKRIDDMFNGGKKDM